AYAPNIDFVSYWSGQDGIDRGVRFVELNGDGCIDLVGGFDGVRTAYVNQGPAPTLLASIENEFGVRTEFTYNRLTEDAYYVADTSVPAFPVRNYISPAYV